MPASGGRRSAVAGEGFAAIVIAKPWSPWSGNDLEQAGRAHSAAYAQRDNDMLHAAPATFEQRVADEPRLSFRKDARPQCRRR